MQQESQSLQHLNVRRVHQQEQTREQWRKWKTVQRERDHTQPMQEQEMQSAPSLPVHTDCSAVAFSEAAAAIAPVSSNNSRTSAIAATTPATSSRSAHVTGVAMMEKKSDGVFIASDVLLVLTLESGGAMSLAVARRCVNDYIKTILEPYVGCSCCGVLRPQSLLRSVRSAAKMLLHLPNEKMVELSQKGETIRQVTSTLYIHIYIAMLM
jgi:hypothetical protein